MRCSWRWYSRWAWAVVKVVQGALLVGLAWLDARAGAGRTAVVVTAVPVGRARLVVRDDRQAGVSSLPEAVAGPAEEGEEA